MNVEDDFPCPSCSRTRMSWTINQIGREGHKTLGQDNEKAPDPFPFPSFQGERKMTTEGPLAL